MDISSASTDEFSNNLHDANAENLSHATIQEILQLNSANCSTIMDISSASTDEFSNNLHDANAENLSDATIQEIPQLNPANSSTIMNISNACTDESSNNLHDANAENLSHATIQEIPQLNPANSSTIMNISNACTDESSNNLHDANAENLSDATIQEIPQLNPANSSTIMNISNACTDESSNNLHDANAENPQSNSVKNCSSSDDLSNSCKATSSVKIGCLKRQDTCPELQLEIDGLSDFYTLTVNPLRTCSAFSASTMKKFLERVKCFLNFCRIKYPERKLDFTFVNDVDVVQAYITYQLEIRLLNISTVVRTITALINLAKYIHRASEDIDSCVQLVRLKNVQRQLSHRQQSHRLATKAGLCGNKTSTFVFQHLLDTIKSLRDKVDSYRGSPRHTRILHDFVLISLYVTSMCGRSKEIRTLQLFNECVEGKEFHFDWKTKCNVFVVSADEGKFTLYENDFKNLRSHGPSKFEIDSSMWLVPYVKEYIRKRTDLLCGKSHSFMFMTATGLAFTSSSFTLYLGDLFEREVHVRAGTTRLRHALVTHVLSLPEAESLRLRESLAVLMRHSLKHQQTTYCDISRQDRTFLSLDLVNKSVAEATSSKKPRVESCAESSCPRKGVESQHSQICVGDMVGLVDSVSTCAEDAVVFVGRVVKIRANEVLLMEFRKVEGRETFYRAVVDSSWWENLNSIIYPIDIVYDSREQAYELRSTVAEIYDAVYDER
jgi:hypothetical protein